jgi:hypothetical protein
LARSEQPGVRIAGLTLRQAALITGFAYLLNPVIYAESIYSKLVVAGNVEQTIVNIVAHHGLFLAALFCYFINFVEDIVIAWALYVLLAPVNQAVSLLAALFQLMYAAIMFVALFNLAIAYRVLTTPEFLMSFGTGPLHAQVILLIHSFRYSYSLALSLFGVHLILVGALIYASRYIPFWLGIILVIDGIAWIVNSLAPYLYPLANLDFLFVAFLGELIFMLWLLIRGWVLRPPITA